MANAAQEEVDRLLGHQQHTNSHPEDQYDSDHSSSDEKHNTTSEPAFQRESLHDDTDDEDLSRNMSTLTTTKTSYHLPTNISYANTGPKGVIADAQSFARAKKSAYRRTLNSNTTITSSSHARTSRSQQEKGLSDQSTPSSLSDLDSDDEDDDDNLMNQWRIQRLAELSNNTTSSTTPSSTQQSTTQLHAQNSAQRRISPSRRTYGTVLPVDAEGYLNAIEHSPATTTVVVLLYDPNLQQSIEVEDELDMLAVQYSNVRFVKLRHEIAEMEELEVPSLIAYVGSEVTGTISGARAGDGLVRVMAREGMLR